MSCHKDKGRLKHNSVSDGLFYHEIHQKMLRDYAGSNKRFACCCVK
ncbi:hypothetical protein LVJ78_09210 [Uruburuella suis]|uniref:Uncharacterized protein n=1 Tax=Uruburuella suis TaxID=252130 RepID=A0AAE9KG54_9NEIS|nr:hypothetical protein [Uruburuella suis]MBP7258214.1 hypothetical protein [Neisseria sp.]MBP8069990.1 hypothetical protein [Neisseria sp.]MBP8875010.1 hypothetical protein [Neisseria sp.]UOO78871.1 hypothetical protein LVJ78_09210 [Uruburuella suis]